MIRLSLKPVLISLIVLLLLLPGFGSAMTLDQIATTCIYSPGGGNGTAATIGVNWTFTGLPGTGAGVVNIGTSSAALLDFTIPAGLQGIPGVNGTDGADGGGVDTSQFLFINGTRAMTGNLQMGTNRITGLGEPLADTDAATQGYVIDAVSGASNYNASYLTSTYNATYDAKANSNYNASYWTGTNYNSSYLTSTYNATYDAKPSSNYNASYWTGTNFNASYWTGTNYNASYDGQSNYNSSYATTVYVGEVNTSMKGYVDAVNSSLNPGALTSTHPVTLSTTVKVIGGPVGVSLTNDQAGTINEISTNVTLADNNSSIPTSGAVRSYIAATSSNYNASYWTGTNYNSSYWTGSNYNATYDGQSNYNGSYVTLSNTSYFLKDGSRSMLGNISFIGQFYINGLTDPIQPQDAATKNYVDTRPANNYNASYWTGTNYNSSYLTSTYNATYDSKPSSTYNATYDAKNNFNASYLNKDGSVAMTGNLSLGTKNINSLGEPTLSTDAATKNYVDTHSSNYNASYLTSTFNATYDAKTNYNASYWAGTNYNSSYATTTDLTNTNNSMKGYVDSVASNYNASYWTGTNYNASYLTSTYNATYDAKTNYNASYLTSTYNATYDAKPNSNYNSSYWTGTNYNASYWTGTNYNSSYWTGTNYNATYDGQSNYNASYLTSTFNATYDAKADTNYNSSYWTGTNYNATYDGQSNYNASYLTSTYNSTYDSKPSSTFNATYDAKNNYNASYLTSTFNSTYDAKPDSTFNATYDAKTNYNSSYWTGTNYNASYLTSTYNATYATQDYVGGINTSMKGYVDGVNTSMKGYVDSVASNYNASYWTGTNYNSSYLTSTYNATYDAKANSNYNASYWTGTNYNSSYWTGTNYNATYDGQSNYNASYITSTYNATYDSKPSSTYNATYDAKTNYNASYWTGSNYNASYLTSTYNATYDANSNYNASYVTLTNGSYVLTSNTSYLLGTNTSIATTTLVTNTNTSMKGYVDGQIAGVSNYNASYVNKDGTVAMTGNLSMGSKYITSLITGGLGSDAVNKTYADSKSYNASYLTSTYNATYDNKANLTQYSYITLMAGSAMYPTTNPPSDFNQFEEPTNKVNWIYANITNSTTQNVQWIVDMPQDWNSGNTVIAQFLWTVQSGSGDLNWTLSGLRFDNHGALDTALPLITYKVDTVLAANDLHVSDATAATAVTGSGNFVIFKVGRSATSDTLGAVPAQLIGVRLKYAKLIGAT